MKTWGTILISGLISILIMLWGFDYLFSQELDYCLDYVTKGKSYGFVMIPTNYELLYSDNPVEQSLKSSKKFLYLVIVEKEAKK